MPLLPLFPLVSLTAALSTIYLLSTGFTTMIKDTFHALTAFVFPLSCSMLTSLYNLPSLNSFSPTPKHRATILLMPVDKGKKKKTAFVFPLSRSLLSYNRPSFSPTLLSDTFSCPYCLCFSLLTAVRSTIFLLNSFALPSKHHPQRYFFMSPLSLFQMSCSMLPSLCNLPSLNSFSRTL
jgi:hypothetical protein